MEQLHIDQTFLEINVPPASVSERDAAVLAVHGRNQTPVFIQNIVYRLGWQKHSVVMPAAAENTWYPKGFMAPLPENETRLLDALNTLHFHHKRLNELGFRDDQIVFLGFSQGACLVSQYVLSNPAKYRGIVVFTGGYIGEQGIEWNFKGDFKGTPLFISSSRIDEWVPVSRTLETVQQFSALNADVHFKLYTDRPHEVCDEEIRLVNNLLGI